jgi:Ca2+-transporting ATPase
MDKQSDRYYSKTVEEILHQFGVTLHSGLSELEAKERREKYGPNRLETTKQKSHFAIFLDQFKSSMVFILLVAAVISGVIGVMEGEGLVETFVILAILIVNAIIGTVQEVGAQTSLEALNKMSAPHS